MDNTWYYNTDSTGRPNIYCKRTNMFDDKWVVLVFFYYKKSFNMDSITLFNDQINKLLPVSHLPHELQKEFISYFFKFNDGVKPQW